MKRLKPLTCPICAAVVQPKTGRQRTCLRPICTKQQRSLACHREPVESNEAKRQRRALALMDELRAEFGVLRQRDLRLMRLVYRKAHTIGYQRGIHARRKADRLKEAA